MPKGTKPETLQVQLGNIPLELRNLNQWCGWRYEYRPERNPSKPWTKPPFQVGGLSAKSNDPSTWASFDSIVRHLDQFDGPGFVFSAGDPYIGIDLDGCRDPLDGFIEPWAQEIIRKLATYTEVSVSGTGVHLIAKGSLPPGGRKKGGFEIYKLGRYFTMSGHWLPDTPREIHERQSELEEVHTSVFGSQEQPTRNGVGPTELSDSEVLQKALSAHNGEKISRLYAGDISGYVSPSEADLALCSLLVFYTGADLALLDRLYRRSKLYRDKWDESHFSTGETYGEHTSLSTTF